MKIVYPKILKKEVGNVFSKSMIDKCIVFSDNLLTLEEEKKEHPFSKFINKNVRNN